MFGYTVSFVVRNLCLGTYKRNRIGGVLSRKGSPANMSH